MKRALSVQRRCIDGRLIGGWQPLIAVFNSEMVAMALVDGIVLNSGRRHRIRLMVRLFPCLGGGIRGSCSACSLSD